MIINTASLIMLCITVMLEAGGESAMGQRAVVYTILNRSVNTGTSIEEVLTKPKQYSCYNKVGLGTLLQSQDYREGAKVYLEVVSLAVESWNRLSQDGMMPPGGYNLFDVTHYHSRDVSPVWSKGYKMHQVAAIGNHIFYVEGK